MFIWPKIAKFIQKSKRLLLKVFGIVEEWEVRGLGGLGEIGKLGFLGGLGEMDFSASCLYLQICN